MTAGATTTDRINHKTFNHFRNEYDFQEEKEDSSSVAGNSR
jgi:hypothetical protein